MSRVRSSAQASPGFHRLRLFLVVAVFIAACSAETGPGGAGGKNDDVRDPRDVLVSDSFVCEGKQFATARGVAESPAGNLYAVGDCDGIWIVRKRASDGQWHTIDQFVHEGIDSAALGVAVDRTGTIVVTGIAVEGSEITGVVRASFDGGDTWSTIDKQVSDLGQGGYPAALQVDASGSVHVAGNLPSNSGANVWTVKRIDPETRALDLFTFADPALDVVGFHVAGDRIFLRAATATSPRDSWVIVASPDQGASFERLPAFVDPDRVLVLEDLATDAGGALRALGVGRDRSQGFVTSLILRTSSDQGQSFATRTHHDPTEPLAEASFLAIGDDGALYVGGDTFALDGEIQIRRWLVRRSDDDGQTWQTVQDLAAPDGTFVQLRGLFGLTGAIYGAGTAEVGNRLHWIVTETRL